MAREPWKTLGIASTRDIAEIRRAYASKLRDTNPEDDPEAFQALRAAYESALQFAAAPSKPARRKIARSAAAPNSAPSREVADAPVRDSTANDHVVPLRQLERLLGHAVSSKDELLDAFEVLLRSPSLEQVDVHAAVEQAVAVLILQYAPQSDPLVAPAVDIFGWKARLNAATKKPSPADVVLERLADLQFLAAVASPTHELYGAYARLKAIDTRKDRFWRLANLYYRGGIRKLLCAIDEEHPTLRRNFDEDTLAWWRNDVQTPHLTLEVVGVSAGLGFLVSFGTLIGQIGLEGVARLVVAPAIGLVSAVVSAALYLYGYAWPRHLWRNEWRWRANLATRAGWLPASLVLAFAAAALEPGLIVSLGLAVAAGGILLWVLVVAEEDGPLLPLRRARLLPHDLCFVSWWFALKFTAFDAYWHMTPAVIVLWASGPFGDQLLRRLYWTHLRPSWRGFVVGGIASLTVLVAWLASSFAEFESSRSFVAAAVASLVAVQRPFGALLGTRWIAMRSGILFYIALFVLLALLKDPARLFFAATLWAFLNFALVVAEVALSALSRRLSL